MLVSSLMLLAASVIWGGGYIAGKLALTTMTPFAILTWRFGFAAMLCGMIFHRKLRGMPKKTPVCGLVLGGIQMIALGLQLTGLQYTTSAKQSFLCTAYVAIIPFLSLLMFGNRMTLREIFAGLISLTGIGFICLEGDLSMNIGDVLSLGFALMYGIQIVLTGRFVSRDTDSIQLSFCQFTSVAILAFIISVLRGEQFVHFSHESVIGVGYLAVLNTLVAYSLQNIAQRKVKDTTAALIISLESVFGFLFSVLYFGTPLTWRLLVGGGLCFAAILLATVGQTDRKV